MAKVTGALMSMSASGSLAKTLVFARWKGRPYVRQHVTPANPQTVLQMAARLAVSVAAALSSWIFGNDQVADAGEQTDQQMLHQASPTNISWANYLARVIIGVGGLRFVDARTAFDALSSTDKDAWEAAAVAASPPVPSVPIRGEGGTITGTISPGEVLYIYTYGLAQAGLRELDDESPPSYGAPA